MTRPDADVAYGLTIVLSGCAERHGVGPCTAFSDPGKECYNTWATCTDRINYNATPRTYDLIASDAYDITSAGAIPCITKYPDVTPAQIKKGHGLAIRAGLKVAAADFPYDDWLPEDDPYRATRNYVPRDTGTFWGKLLARFPYHQHAPALFRQGHWEGDTPVWTSEHFWAIDRIDFGGGGIATIHCKDLLYYIDKETTRTPEPSDSVLLSGLGSGSGPHKVEFDPKYNDYYNDQPLPGMVLVDDELIHYTGVDLGKSELTGVTRGYFNTETVSHDEGEPFTRVYFVEGRNVVDVIADLLHIYGNVPKDLIPYDAYQDVPTGTPDLWDIERETWLSAINLSNVISDPKGVAAIIDDICQQVGIVVWWDQVNARIGLNASAFGLGGEDQEVITDEMMLADTLKVQELRQQIISRVWIYYNKNNFLEADDLSNFNAIVVAVNTDLETAQGIGRAAVYQTMNHWLHADSTGEIIAQAARTLVQRSMPRYTVQFDAHIDALPPLAPGSYFTMRSAGMQGASGEPALTRCQVTKLRSTNMGQALQVTGLTLEMETPGDKRYARVGPDTLLDYNDESAANRDMYAWLQDKGEFFDDGHGPYLII